MRALASPESLPANNRVQPTETNVFTVNATLKQYKLESDSDYSSQAAHTHRDHMRPFRFILEQSVNVVEGFRDGAVLEEHHRIRHTDRDNIQEGGPSQRNAIHLRSR